MRTFESEPMQSGMPRCSIRAAGRKPSARSASVVGHAQTVVPLSASRSSSAPSACVAWTTVTCGPRQPVRASSSIGRQPCSARHSSISRGCSHAWMCSGSPSARGVAADLLEPVARAGADGVGGEADPDAVVPQRLELARGTRPRTPGASAAARRARRRRGGARARCRPRRRPPRPRAPRRRRGSGTRRRRCSRRGASRRRRARRARARVAGVCRSASASISSRHAQKSPPPARPRSAR